MKVKAYEVLTRAIDEGIAYGYQRAFKHTDSPEKEDIKESIHREVMNAICEVFSFDDELED